MEQKCEKTIFTTKNRMKKLLDREDSVKCESKKYLRFKRYADVLLALIGLVVLAPFLFIVLVCIKCSDIHSSAIFKQTRVGKTGKLFCMYKFRTMRADAEEQLEQYLALNEVEGAMFKIKEDPRVTKIGRILRTHSIDELPQLINVLKGEMSLIGPRPPLPREVALYTAYEKQRLMVTPGCTGLWQVNGRSKLSFKEMVELDLMYIQSISFFLDVKIMGKTVKEIVFPKGGY